MKRVVLLGISAAIVVASVLPAAADPTVITDPNDAKGLDISKVTLDADTLPPVWTIRTFRRWTIFGIWDRGYFILELDTIGGPRVEYRALVRSDGRRMIGRLYRIRRHASDKMLGKLKAHKVNARSVAVKVPLSKLTFGPDRTSYRWDVVTTYANKRCPSATCFDRAPDARTVDQPLPGA
jgi:hypothetical protein